MRAVGIDLGTTSICGVLIDTDTGKVLRSRTESGCGFLPGCASWERIQDPEKTLSLTRGILEDLLEENTVAVGVTGQMHGIVYVDDRGKAVSPLYNWQDGRGNQPYGTTTYAGHLGSCSGYGNVTDFYNRQNGLVPENAAGYCTIHDYLVMQLCGLTKPRIHVSDAASFGCFDLERNRFLYDCPIEPIADFAVAGTFRGIPVGVAIGDNQASVFSSLADNDSVLLNMGTGSQVSILSDRVMEVPGIETRPYFEGKYLVAGSALCGGRAYAVLKDFYGRLLRYATDITDEQIYGIMGRMLAASEDALTVDTRFDGTRTDASLRGSIQGISTKNFTPEALTKGFMEGMVRELHDLYRAMEQPKTGLVGSGNGLRKNPALQKAAEAAFSAPMRIPAHTEEAAYGAALYALIAAGYYPNAREAQRLIRFHS